MMQNERHSNVFSKTTEYSYLLLVKMYSANVN